RLSDSPVMRGERRSICGSPKAREQIAWVASANAIASALLSGLAPKSIQPKLKASREASAAIWKWRASEAIRRMTPSGHAGNDTVRACDIDGDPCVIAATGPGLGDARVRSLKRGRRAKPDIRCGKKIFRTRCPDSPLRRA